MTVVRTGVLAPDGAAEAGRLLAASHADYPAFVHLFGERKRRRRVLEPFMAATARDAARHALALEARDAAGLVGVALWMPPGTFPLTAARKARMTPAMLRVMWHARAALPAFVRIGSTLERSLPDHPLWYLQVLGVHPRAQRGGVGERLMRRGLAEVERMRLPCHLHTSDPANVPYYERYGFEVVHPALETGAGGPRYIGMARPAAP